MPLPYSNDDEELFLEVPNRLNRCLNGLVTENKPFKQVFKQFDGVNFTENGAICKGFELILTTGEGLGIVHRNGHTGVKEILGKSAVKNRLEQNKKQMEKAITKKGRENREMWVNYWQRGLDLIERAENQATQDENEIRKVI